MTQTRMSIKDAMVEALLLDKTEEQAIIYCRARLHIPRVSTKRLGEYYRFTRNLLVSTEPPTKGK